MASAFQGNAFQANAFQAVAGTSAQAQCFIAGQYFAQGQAQVLINHKYILGQAQVKIHRPQGYGQARAAILGIGRTQLVHSDANTTHPGLGFTATAGRVVIVFGSQRDGTVAYTPDASPTFSVVSSYDANSGQVSPWEPSWLWIAHATGGETYVDGHVQVGGSNLGIIATEWAGIDFSAITGGAPTHGFTVPSVGPYNADSDTVTPPSDTNGMVVVGFSARGDTNHPTPSGWTLIDAFTATDHPTIYFYTKPYYVGSGSIQFNTTINNDNRYWDMVIAVFPALPSLTAGYGQAQCYIKGIRFGQAQADIKATQSKSAQAQTDIKKTSQAYGQAQALIITLAFGQAQVYIVNTKATGLAQVQIIGRPTRTGQAIASIRQSQVASGQALASITSRRPSGQAQASINQSSHAGQANADIKSISQRVGNAQTLIKTFNVKCGQARASIKQVAMAFGQALALITNKRGFGQAQCFVTMPLKIGQAQCLVTRAQGYGQALAAINHGASGQAQGLVKIAGKGSGQGQALIVKNAGSGQGQADIKTTNRNTGQALAQIIKSTGYGQAQCSVKRQSYGVGQACALVGHLHSGQAQAYINSQKYIVKYNGYNLPGYAQTESYDSVDIVAQLSFDGSFSEYLGLQNKSIKLTTKTVGETLYEAKEQVQQAATILRSSKGFAKLYVQRADRYYLALAQKVSMDNDAEKNTKNTDYSLEFEAKPWAISETLTTVSGTGTVVTTGRTLNNGGWSPTSLLVTGTNITISGYTESGDFTGYVSVSGSVVNLEINSEMYSATMNGVSKNYLMNNLDYALYVGPGVTNFEISGATECVISWQDRWYL